MTEIIDYDFSLSKSVCKELDVISQLLKQNAANAERDNLTVLAKEWNSEASVLFEKKYTAFLRLQKMTANEIEEESEKIKLLTKRLYLIEEQAKQKAVERGT